MVKHQPLQVYEKQILLSLVTGLYGCRWKRYQRSQDESSKVRHSLFNQVQVLLNIEMFACAGLGENSPITRAGFLMIFNLLSCGFIRTFFKISFIKAYLPIE